MADVAGHGTPAAVIMTVMPTLIHAELPSNRDKWAGEFLEHVNRVMSETYLRDRRFVTVWAAVLDPVSRRLTYASAGHNPPRLLRGGSVLALDVAGGVPLGIDPAATDEDVGITLEPEDLLVMHTDGITEAMRRGIDGLELFGTKRLDRVLCECGSDRASDDTERVRKAIAAFTNYAAPTDDQTMLILRARSTSPWSQNGTYYRPDETLRRDSEGSYLRSDRLAVVFHRLNISWTLMYALNAGEEYLIEKGGVRGAKVVAGIRTLPSTSETLPKT